MSTVVVTGASSFVGCHLVHAFAAAGWQVIATHSQPRAGYAGIQAERLAWAEPVAGLRRLDLRDHASLASFAAETKPTLWIQHAGYATNYGSPDYDMAQAEAINVAPLAPLYAALARRSCGVIVTGSSMEYAPSDRADTEDASCAPATPYGRAKLAETEAAEALARQHGVPTRVARVYIPFGSYDNPKKLISTVAAALRAGRPVDLSSCEQKRDFIAVEELCRGYVALAGDMARVPFDIFNLCSGTALALKALLLGLAKAAGRDPTLLRFGTIPMRADEAPISYGDNSKAARLLSWRPEAPEAALRRMVVGAA